mgnify:FL=1
MLKTSSYILKVRGFVANLKMRGAITLVEQFPSDERGHFGSRRCSCCGSEHRLT